MNEFFSSLISAELGLIGVTVPADHIWDRSAADAGGTATRAPTEAAQPAPRIVFQDIDRRSALG